METRDLFTLAIAVYAAALSTFNTYHQWRDKRSRVNVEMSIGILGLPQGGTSDAVLLLKASNPAHKPVLLTMPGILLPDGRTMSFVFPKSHVTFPFELKAEHACTIWDDVKRLAGQLRTEGFRGTIKLKGFYDDAVGRRHFSKTQKFNLDAW